MIRFEIYKDNHSNDKIGTFFVPDNASEEWLKRNIPPLIHDAQIFAEKAEPWEPFKEE